MEQNKINTPAGEVIKYTFPTFAALEEFFLKNIKNFKGYKTKVIGKTLLKWKR